MRLVATIEERDVIVKILRHLDLPTEPLPIAPARDPPQLMLNQHDDDGDVDSLGQLDFSLARHPCVQDIALSALITKTYPQSTFLNTANSSNSAPATFQRLFGTSLSGKKPMQISYPWR